MRTRHRELAAPIVAALSGALCCSCVFGPPLKSAERLRVGSYCAAREPPSSTAFHPSEDPKLPAPGAAVGITGGLAGAGFGFATLAVHRTTTFRHEPNILGELWRGEAHPSFPDTVWAYLTRPEFSRTGDRTLREYLMETWRESGALGDDPAHPARERVDLYFGSGGVYDASGLDDRSNMLSDVREVVNLMNHGLQHLASEAAQN